MIGTKNRETLAESITDAHALSPRSARPGVFRSLLGQRVGVIGLVIVTVMVLVAIAAPVLAPDDPTRIDAARRLTSPSADAWLGTDNPGRDIVSRRIWGARLGLGTARAAAALILTIGVGAGVLAGFDGGSLEGLRRAVVDVLVALAGPLPRAGARR